MKIEDIDEYVDQAELAKRSKRLKSLLSKSKKVDYVALQAEYFDELANEYRKRHREKAKAKEQKRAERENEELLQVIKYWNSIKYDGKIEYMMKRELKASALWQKFCPRAVVTPYKLKLILMEIEKRRLEEYLNPPPADERLKIMCIVGESGSGKTLASLHLKYKLGANVICSFTTRPPRPTEVEGRDHHFIDVHPEEIDILAQTIFGGYRYYALRTQVFGPCTVYVIDEDGIRDLRETYRNKYRLFTVYLKRDKKLRRKSNVNEKRMNRDAERRVFKEKSYDYIVDNNSTKKHFFEQIERIYNEIKNME